MPDQPSRDQHGESGVNPLIEKLAEERYGHPPVHYPLRLRFRIWLYRRAVAFDQWRDRRRKFTWKCYRDGGGGVLVTPKPMSEERATKWLQRTANAEIIYIDRNYHFLFYRSLR